MEQAPKVAGNNAPYIGKLVGELCHRLVTYDKMNPGRFLMSIMMVPSSISLTASVPAASTIILSSSDKESALLMTAWKWCTASWGRVPKIDGTWPCLDLVDRFRCCVVIFFEGMNLVKGISARCLRELLLFKRKCL